jgi:hypothetical protein
MRGLAPVTNAIFPVSPDAMWLKDPRAFVREVLEID